MLWADKGLAPKKLLKRLKLRQLYQQAAAAASDPMAAYCAAGVSQLNRKQDLIELFRAEMQPASSKTM